MKFDCDLHAPLNQAQAQIESARCYFCHDAPCITACPTGIDIPQFIRKIQTGATLSAAKTILESNIMGGTCARVCPVEVLCQGACVRNKAEDKPVEIGLLQRFATDALFAKDGFKGDRFFSRSKATGKRIAIVGAGPAGLACAHELSRYGHDCTIFEAKPKAGGLNEYGLAPYKMIEDFAQKEISFIESLGGIEIKFGKRLGADLILGDLERDFDAVFLGVGLGSTHKLGVEGEDLPFVEDAINFIEKIRRGEKNLFVGEHVVVIGGGSTAIDVAIESRILGAKQVTIVVRRSISDMKATSVECELAQTQGVKIADNLTPQRILSERGLGYIEFHSTGKSAEVSTVMRADRVFKAIGQTLDPSFAGPEIEQKLGKIMVDQNMRTSRAKVYAGGDCVNGGSLTVKCVEDGKKAARAIDKFLGGKNS